MQKHSFWKFFHSKKSGQISILMALIFPVLFVFFAMTINIGLVVHDKINLQNSTDLAAYYAAQKQAEILNTIAHLNYQIRQNWKLLSFRIRAFGSLGLGSHRTPHLLHPFRSSITADEYEWDGDIPTVCTQFYDFWQELYFFGPDRTARDTGNECQAPASVIRGFQPPLVISGIFNFELNTAIRQLSLERLESLEMSCKLAGTTNWILVATWIRAYRKALYYRKRAIKELAERLKDGKDLHGFDIAAGARETFVNNLTRSNREALLADGGLFELFNSMEGIEWNQWLVERPLYPVVYYTDTTWVPTGLETGDCNREPKPHFSPPVHIDEYHRLWGREELEKLQAFLPEGIEIDSSEPSLNLNSMTGYEKNPWFMVYSGVRVQISPREPFSPFVGRNVLTMKAKAFAKPFGGKIGPWMHDSWPRGEDISEGNPTDINLSPIRDPGRPFRLPDPLEVGFATPNYARYPGDPFGLKSFAALSVYRESLIPSKLSYLDFIDEDDFLPPEGLEVSTYKYDPLIWRIDRPTDARIMEVMAISPDLFDITYYSIDPQFYMNHSDISDPNLEFRRMTLDLGARFNAATTFEYPPNSFGVFDQWAWANDHSRSLHIEGIPSSYNPVGRASTANWFVKDWTHLLTGWVPDIENQFGQCNRNGDLTPENRNSEFLPGSCGIGGRMGYSVKLISKRYLTSSLPLGGSSSGQIRNSPPF